MGWLEKGGEVMTVGGSTPGVGAVINPVGAGYEELKNSGYGSTQDIMNKAAEMDPTNPGKFNSSVYDVNPDAFTNEDRSNALRAQFAQQLAQSQGRMSNMDMGPQAGMRNAQNQLMNQLQLQSMGQGPSLAQNQLQQGIEGNIRSAMAMGTSHPGMNPALAQRGIAQQIAGANQAQALNAANMRMQEQLNAQQQLGGLSTNIRGQDIGLSNQQAQNQLAMQGLNDQQSRFFNTGLAEQNAQDRAAKMALEKLKADQIAGVNATNAQAFAQRQAGQGNMIGNIGGAIAGIAAMASDEELKKKMRDAGPDIERTLDQFSLKDRTQHGDSPKSDTRLGQGLASAGKSLGDRNKSAGSDWGTPVGMDANTDTNMGSSEFTAACGGMVPHKYAHGDEISGEVPGQAKVSGDSEKNDFVKALLSPGEIVLPRTVAQEAIQDPDSEKLKGFLDNLKATKYQYKDEKWGAGDHVSPMAQDLEKSDLGKQMVVDTPQGKMVDYGKGFGYMLAAQAHNHRRLGDLEAAFKKMYGGGEVSFADAKEDDSYQQHAKSIKTAFTGEEPKKPKEKEESLWDKIKRLAE